MQAPVGDITLEYDTFGSPDDPTILLVMGLSTQMIAWQPGFCQMFVDRGFHVVRFDNRDIGLSTKHHGVASGIVGLPSALKLRLSGKAPYHLSDLFATSERDPLALNVATISHAFAFVKSS